MPGHGSSGVDVLLATELRGVRGHAGIDGFMREAADPDDFVVTPARIDGGLDDEVRRVVERDVGDVGVCHDRAIDGNRRGRSAIVLNVGRGRAGIDGGIEVAAVVARAAEHRVGGVAGQRSGVENLRILSRGAEGEMIPCLGHAEAVLARPYEAHNVVRVDGLGVMMSPDRLEMPFLSSAASDQIWPPVNAQ